MLIRVNRADGRGARSSFCANVTEKRPYLHHLLGCFTWSGRPASMARREFLPLFDLTVGAYLGVAVAASGYGAELRCGAAQRASGICKGFRAALHDPSHRQAHKSLDDRRKAVARDGAGPGVGALCDGSRPPAAAAKHGRVRHLGACSTPEMLCRSSAVLYSHRRRRRRCHRLRLVPPATQPARDLDGL